MNAKSRTKKNARMSPKAGFCVRLEDGFPLGAFVPVYDVNGKHIGLRGDYDWIMTLISRAKYEDGIMSEDPAGFVVGQQVFRKEELGSLFLAVDQFSDFARQTGNDLQIGFGRKIVSIRIRPAEGAPDERLKDFASDTMEMGHFNGHFFPADSGVVPSTPDKINRLLLSCLGSVIANAHGLPIDHFQKDGGLAGL